jgi:hypothetical protein
MEIDALYCDLSMQHWKEFTGRQAERLATAGEATHD